VLAQGRTFNEGEIPLAWGGARFKRQRIGHCSGTPAEKVWQVVYLTAQKVKHLRSGVVGIGVGLLLGYNAARRLYAKGGYLPDARGITYRNRLWKRAKA